MKIFLKIFISRECFCANDKGNVSKINIRIQTQKKNVYLHFVDLLKSIV